jgi:hypothetical protein
MRFSLISHDAADRIFGKMSQTLIVNDSKAVVLRE